MLEYRHSHVAAGAAGAQLARVGVGRRRHRGHSAPEAEWRETLHKVAALFAALGVEG